MTLIEQTFTQIGGQFITPAERLWERLQNIKVFAFDWDGVFNDAIKSTGHPNGFSEADSMGINLTRYDYYLRNGELPLAIVLSGEENPTAVEYTNRENFTALYFKMKNKGEALEHICKTFGVEPSQVAWFFDDVLDLALAKVCGARFYLARPSQPMTTKFALDNGMVDYISGHDGSQHGLRECCELIMSLNGNFDTILSNRLSFAPNYAEYFAKRLEVKPRKFSKHGDGIVEVA
ncbi:MAG TPA: phosphatase [Bacteroidia bacterium]|nr:phosphatase [Bacteroidia bacterium]